MTNDERAAILVSCASEINRIASRLRLIKEERLLPCDAWALGGVLGHLQWAAENCSVMAKHARGEGLHDDMGYYTDMNIGPKERQLPQGMTILQANHLAQSQLT